NILDIDVAEGVGKQWPRPPREPGRRRVVQQRKDALVRRLRVDRLLPRTRLVLQTPKAFIGKAMPPKAGDPRLYTDPLGNRPSAPASRRKQNNSGTLQITLQRPRRAAASLKHLALLRRKPDFSCFGNHPDLDSRLTFQEKRVLAETFMDQIQAIVAAISGYFDLMY